MDYRRRPVGGAARKAEILSYLAALKTALGETASPETRQAVERSALYPRAPDDH